LFIALAIDPKPVKVLEIGPYGNNVLSGNRELYFPHWSQIIKMRHTLSNESLYRSLYSMELLITTRTKLNYRSKEWWQYHHDILRFWDGRCTNPRSNWNLDMIKSWQSSDGRLKWIERHVLDGYSSLRRRTNVWVRELCRTTRL